MITAKVCNNPSVVINQNKNINYRKKTQWKQPYTSVTSLTKSQFKYEGNGRGTQQSLTDRAMVCTIYGIFLLVLQIWYQFTNYERTNYIVNWEVILYKSICISWHHSNIIRGHTLLFVSDCLVKQEYISAIDYLREYSHWQIVFFTWLYLFVLISLSESN